MAVAILGFVFPHNMQATLEESFTDKIIHTYRDDPDLQNLIDFAQKEVKFFFFKLKYYEEYYFYLSLFSSFNVVVLVQKDILIGQKMNILTAHLLALRNAVCLIRVVSMQQIFRFVKNVFVYLITILIFIFCRKDL